ncbi:unnamed protein product [Arabidopsis arenosa]|uniref:RING-type domain-containing protein n=1 Tax=Arabidopsis arenosa TaxID=38785 RepID=A0A8S1ZCI5_ARAAE|nr:unnamed protein product [Arabidopsis arenosa]
MMNTRIEGEIQGQKLQPSEGITNTVTVVFKFITEETHEDQATGVKTLVQSDPHYFIRDFSIESTCHSHICDRFLINNNNNRSLCEVLSPLIASTATNLGFGVNGFVIRLVLTITTSVHVVSSASVLRRLVCEGIIDGEEVKRLKMETEPCSICLENLSGSNTRGFPTRMSCSHVFHDRCLLEWFRRKNTCPMCRRVVSECLMDAWL